MGPIRSFVGKNPESRNALVDLSQFADIRQLSDITKTKSGSNTVLDLGDGQKLVLSGYTEGHGNYKETEHGNYQGKYGSMFHFQTRHIGEDSFKFYDGTLTGTNKGETLLGGRGVDNILGHGGDDILEGRASNDILDGGFGDDTLKDGSGSDRLERRLIKF